MQDQPTRKLSKYFWTTLKGLFLGICYNLFHIYITFNLSSKKPRWPFPHLLFTAVYCGHGLNKMPKILFRVLSSFTSAECLSTCSHPLQLHCYLNNICSFTKFFLLSLKISEIWNTDMGVSFIPIRTPFQWLKLPQRRMWVRVFSSHHFFFF